MTALLQSLPEYAQAMEAMQQLRERYELEAQHNEDDFRRRFQEYLQGQKNFPEPILLKRQGDLERAMEEGLEFRRQADSLLVVAERAPQAGQWDRRGSKLWVNGTEIAAPTWKQPDASIPQDNATQGLKNENLTATAPSRAN